MITKDQVLQKVNELTAYCEANGYEGGGYAGFISALTPAITQYFNSTSAELEENVRDLIFKLYNDIMMRDTTYERPVGKPLPTNFPKGYDDLTKLFDGAGAFDAILSISPDTFLNGFPVEVATDTEVASEDGDSTETIIVKTNPIIAEWTTAISTAHNAEINGIQAIMNFCERCAFGQALIALFEDRGKMTQTKDKQALAKEIYIDMKVKEVIETFNLDVHIPTYL